MIHEHKKLESACRRFKFEALNAMGIFWLIDKITWLNIKEPWNTLYKRTRK